MNDQQRILQLQRQVMILQSQTTNSSGTAPALPPPLPSPMPHVTHPASHGVTSHGPLSSHAPLSTATFERGANEYGCSNTHGGMSASSSSVSVSSNNGGMTLSTQDPGSAFKGDGNRKALGDDLSMNALKGA